MRDPTEGELLITKFCLYVLLTMSSANAHRMRLAGFMHGPADVSRMMMLLAVRLSREHNRSIDPLPNHIFEFSGSITSSKGVNPTKKPLGGSGGESGGHVGTTTEVMINILCRRLGFAPEYIRAHEGTDSQDETILRQPLRFIACGLLIKTRISSDYWNARSFPCSP
jgi:hypothetical protein